MSLKKMHEERKEAGQTSRLQEDSLNSSMSATEVSLIEQQRLRIEAQEKRFEELRDEYRKTLKSKENQNKRAWEEVDRLRSKPPEIRYEYRYKDKCATCRIEDRTRNSMSSWRYARFLTIMLIVCIVSELIQSTAFLRDLLAFSIVLLKACSYILIGPLYSGYYLANLSGWLQDNSKLYTFGQIVQFLLPTIIYVTYFLLWKFALPLFLEWVRKKKTKRHIPWMIGVHVLCGGSVAALCWTEGLQDHVPFPLNSMVFPLGSYIVWLLICNFIEGCWWFEGWDELHNRWW